MSLFELFKDEIRKLPTTVPVFDIQISTAGWQGVCLELEPINKINYHLLLTDTMWVTDTMKALAITCARETIESGQKAYSINIESAKNTLCGELRRHMMRFIEVYVGKDSDMYKWYQAYAFTERMIGNVYMEPILGLYKYICINSAPGHHRELNVMSEKHKQNVIGILEFIHQRDAKIGHVPPPQKRRRRRK